MPFVASEKIKSQKDKLNLELDRELVAKSIAATPGIMLAALWVGYTRLESVEYANLILLFSSLIVNFLAVRFAVIYLAKKKSISFSSQVTYFKTSIITVALLWVPVILLPVIEFRLVQNNITSIQIIALLLGLTISSVSTLAYRLTIAFCYQLILIVPPLLFFLYLYLTEKNVAALNCFVILAIDIVFIFRQTREVNNEMKLRIRNALALELSNKLLTSSREQLIRESAKLLQATKLATLGEISGEIAHEINNPLSIIQGNIDLILSSVEKNQQDPENVKSKLHKASTAIVRITKIIAGLKRFSRSTEHEPKMRIELNHLIHETLEFSSEKINFNKVKVNFSNSGKFYTQARSVEIAQVILNILSNGIDALTKIPIELRAITILISATDEIINIRISNSGEKIRPHIAAKLFDSYFSTKASDKGMGLGLSISKRIVEAHNGRLYYEPDRPETTFVIELPALN